MEKKYINGFYFDSELLKKDKNLLTDNEFEAVIVVSQDTFIRRMKSEGIWNKLDCFYLANEKRLVIKNINWINP